MNTSTCFNESIRVLAAPTDPRWRAELQAAKELDEKARMLGVRDRDANLCRVQCQQRAAGLQMAEIYHTIYGFRAREVWADGSFFGSRFETKEAGITFLMQWYAEMPERREVIDRCS